MGLLTYLTSPKLKNKIIKYTFPNQNRTQVRRRANPERYPQRHGGLAGIPSSIKIYSISCARPSI